MVFGPSPTNSRAPPPKMPAGRSSMLAIVNWNEHAGDFPTTSQSLAPPDTSELRARIRGALDGSKVEYLGCGFNNSHHLVNTTDGRRIVVRRALAPIPALRTRLDREYAVLEALLGHAYAH